MQGRTERLRRHANHISAVVEIDYGDARIVLGGDLPRYLAGNTRVEIGWDHVLAQHAHLGDHVMLKIPHHGSREAHHPDLMTMAEAQRAWCVTPYNSSRLPRLTAGDGIDLLLQSTPSVFLTAIPASKLVQAQQPDPGRVHFSQLRARTDMQRTGDHFLDAGVDIRPGSACGPLDAVWCFAVDENGALRGHWRGAAALEVIRDASGV
jgi:hypothetical protein